MSLEKEKKDFKDNTSDMTKKEKLGYIWEYYRIHIIVALCLIFFAGSIISGIVNKKEYVLNVTLLSKYFDSNKLDSFQKEVTSVMVDNPKKKQVGVESMFFDLESKDEMMSASVQKLTAEIATSSIDVMIMDKAIFEGYASQDIFHNLDQISELYSLKQSGLTFVNAKDSKGIDGVYGINVEDCKVLKDAGYDVKGKVATIVVNTKRMDNSIKFIKWLFKK